MKKLILLLTVSAALLSACAGASDADLQKMIGDKIHSDPNLKTVSVMVKEGSVTLAGEVDSQTQQKLAESMAKQIDGVKKVDNKIVIKSDSGSTMPAAPPSGAMNDTSNSTMKSNSSMSNN